MSFICTCWSASHSNIEVLSQAALLEQLPQAGVIDEVQNEV